MHAASGPEGRKTAAQDADERRGFLAKFAAVVCGGIATIVPFAAGLYVFVDPLRRKGALGRAVRVTTLEALPDDGIPRRFPVIADRTDSWTSFPSEPIGAVFLRHVGGEVTAVNAHCPHAGCFVDFFTDKDLFRCPCHDSSFQPDGIRIDPAHCPSPRDLDPLRVELRGDGSTKEVWVHYEDFLAGTAQRIAEA